MGIRPQHEIVLIEGEPPILTLYMETEERRRIDFKLPTLISPGKFPAPWACTAAAWVKATRVEAQEATERKTG
jgi:hypothetical protein